MISVTPLTSISLAHYPTFVAVAARAGEIVAFNRSGAGELMSPEGSWRKALKVPPVNAVAFNSDGQRIAVATDEGLLLLDGRTGGVLSTSDGKYDGCQFSISGNRLWASRRPSGEEAVIELRAAPEFEVIDQVNVEDPYGESVFWLAPHPDESSAAIWAAAGQDGQAIFWATDRGTGISVERFDKLNQSTPPAFNSDGSSFLVVADFEELHCYAYPHGPRRSVFAWPSEEDEHDRFGDLVAFVDDRHALLLSANGLLHLVDLAERRMLDDVVIVGHEPRPLSELYRTLSDSSLGSDISYFQPMDQQMFLSVHRHRPGGLIDERSEILIWWLDPASYRREAEQGSLGL